ncbi:MAG: hypothetical protein QXR82_04360 [Candidatus Bathyarchaeia archaeon]
MSKGIAKDGNFVGKLIGFKAFKSGIFSKLLAIIDKLKKLGLKPSRVLRKVIEDAI